MKILFYIVVIMTVLMLLQKIFSRRQTSSENKEPSKFRFRPKATNRDTWIQVYDTDSADEIKLLQARLEEEEVECFIYEQGRKDIHGNQLKGFGIAVPRTAVSHAQKIISRMPV